MPVVLVVEDNATMRALIRSFVEEVTPVVHECESGEEAVELYRQLHPDWVLMDLRMGGMDGIGATRAIRRLDPEARVVMVTEHDDERHRRKADAAGACDFLSKENLLALPSLLRKPRGPSTGEADPS